MAAKNLGWMGVVVFVGAVGCAGAQVAAAKADARGQAPAATVKADDDKGLTGEIPLDTAGVPDPKDVSAVGSPIAAGSRGVWIKASTPVSVTLTQPVSSGVQGNGAMLTGVLAAPVTASNGRVLKAGTPVKVTVLSAAKAGQVQSAGVLSLQVVQVGGVAVTTDVLEFQGQDGKREVADANPEKGTEAMVQAGARLKFQVLGSGDTFDTNETVGKGGSSVSVGAGTVSAPAGFAKPVQGSTTEIHGATTPH